MISAKNDMEQAEESGSSWDELVKLFPEYARYDGAWYMLEGVDWAKILVRHPQFADRCDWSKLDGNNWVHLLLHKPKFADKCDWAKLDAPCWVTLISPIDDYYYQKQDQLVQFDVGDFSTPNPVFTQSPEQKTIHGQNQLVET